MNQHVRDKKSKSIKELSKGRNRRLFSLRKQRGNIKINENNGMTGSDNYININWKWRDNYELNKITHNYIIEVSKGAGRSERGK